jgi:hypothetical protein
MNTPKDAPDSFIHALMDRELAPAMALNAAIDRVLTPSPTTVQFHPSIRSRDIFKLLMDAGYVVSTNAETGHLSVTR